MTIDPELAAQQRQQLRRAWHNARQATDKTRPSKLRAARKLAATMSPENITLSIGVAGARELDEVRL